MPKAYTHTVMFKPTCDCNLNCKYCYDKPMREKFKGQVASKEVLDHTVKLMSNHADNIMWYWHGGEVTTLGSQYLYDAQESFAQQYTSNFKQAMQTNGLIPMVNTEEWINTMKDCGIGIGFSFDLFGQSARLGKDVDITAKYEDMLEEFDMSGARNGIECITVVTSKTLPKLIETYEHFKGRFPGKYKFDVLLVFEIDEDDPSGLGISEEEYIEYYPKYLEHVLLDTSPYAMIDSYLESYLVRLLGYYDTSLCGFIDCRRKWLSVHPDGTVTHCDREPGKYYDLGNILDYKSVDDVYACEGYTKFEADYEERLEDYCRKCNFYGLCTGGCPSNHGAVNSTRANKCNPRECYTQQQNFISVFDMLYSIDDRTRINKALQVLLDSYPIRLPREIYSEICNLGIEVDSDLNIDYYHNNTKEFMISEQYRLFEAFKNMAIEITTESVAKLLGGDNGRY